MSLVGLFAAKIVGDLIKGIWTFINRHKGPTGDEFRALTKALTESSVALNEQKLITKKMGDDVRRVYLFLKVIAGEQWPAYRSKVEEIEKEN